MARVSVAEVRQSEHSYLGIHCHQHFNTNDYSEVRNVAIDEYTQSQNDVETSGIHDASFSLSNSNSGNGGIYEYRLQTGGTIVDSSGASIAVLTDPEMYQKHVAPGLIVEAVPFNGQICLTADDGSSLKLIAVQPGDTDSRQTDVVYTSSDSEVSTQQAVNFAELVVLQP